MSRILPTSLVFISGYANTENVFYCLNITTRYDFINGVTTFFFGGVVSEGRHYSLWNSYIQLPPGLSLAFAGLSETFTKMSPPPLWSSLFYFLLFLLGSSSMLGMIEIVLVTGKEMKVFKRTWRNEIICGKLFALVCRDPRQTCR